MTYLRRQEARRLDGLSKRLLKRLLAVVAEDPEHINHAALATAYRDAMKQAYERAAESIIPDTWPEELKPEVSQYVKLDSNYGHALITGAEQYEHLVSDSICLEEMIRIRLVDKDVETYMREAMRATIRSTPSVLWHMKTDLHRVLFYPLHRDVPQYIRHGPDMLARLHYLDFILKKLGVPACILRKADGSDILDHKVTGSFMYGGDTILETKYVRISEKEFKLSIEIREDVCQAIDTWFETGKATWKNSEKFMDTVERLEKSLPKQLEISGPIWEETPTPERYVRKHRNRVKNFGDLISRTRVIMERPDLKTGRILCRVGRIYPGGPCFAVDGKKQHCLIPRDWEYCGRGFVKTLQIPACVVTGHSRTILLDKKDFIAAVARVAPPQYVKLSWEDFRHTTYTVERFYNIFTNHEEQDEPGDVRVFKMDVYIDWEHVGGIL